MGGSEGTGVKQPGIERRNLKALVIGLGVLVITGLCGLKVISGFVRKVGL